MRGCGNGSMWVDVDFPAPHVMYLRRRWKTFTRAHSLSEGLVLHFKLMENDLLSVKVFGNLGTHLRGCVESSPSDETSSSGESDEEDCDSDDEGVKWEDAHSNSSLPSAAAPSSASPSSLGHAPCRGPSPPCSPSARSPSPLLCLHLPHLGGKGQERRSRGTYPFF